MPKRSVNWEKGLSTKLINNSRDRKKYFLALLQEGFSWREALKIVIDTIGVKEYAELSGIKAPNLIAQLSLEKDIRLSTLLKMIEPLNVHLSFRD